MSLQVGKLYGIKHKQWGIYAGTWQAGLAFIEKRYNFLIEEASEWLLYFAGWKGLSATKPEDVVFVLEVDVYKEEPYHHIISYKVLCGDRIGWMPVSDKDSVDYFFEIKPS